MTNEILEQLPSLSIEELWNLFNELDENGVISQRDFYKVKIGFRLNLDIREIINYKNGESKLLRLKERRKGICIGNQLYDITDFYDECDKRARVMRRWIREYYEEKGPQEDR